MPGRLIDYQAARPICRRPRSLRSSSPARPTIPTTGDSSSRRPFHFALTPPEGGWPAADADTLVFPLDAEAALVVERGPAQS